jgi:UDP-N-acetylmuramoylalanine--D-glutamate ligase
MYLKNQTFLVLGLSKSGCEATEFLLAKKALVYVYDDISNARIEQALSTLVEKGAKRVESEELSGIVGRCDGLVLSPGIPIDHPIAVEFRQSGKAVLGETEIATRHMRATCIGITGTNGKTTTVSLLTEILNNGGMIAKSCGNIGAPMVGFCDMNEEEVAVAEISSFQLETLNSFRPHIAIVLNVTEDHLNRHYNMENYVFLKRKLLKNLTETEYAILNYDDPIVREFSAKTKSKVLYFSVRERVHGAYYLDGTLYFGEEKILAASELFDDSLHNIQNALACIIAAKLMGIKTADIAASLTSFKGVRHRLEFVDEIDGVYYVNDSKGTNVDATVKALSAINTDIVLLLGGKNKGYNYAKLFKAVGTSRVKHSVLYGENRYELLESARGLGIHAFTLCDSFDFAVRIAMMKAEKGQTVLLSPASASFDEFAGYEERGDRFVEIVRSITKDKSREKEESLPFDGGNSDEEKE